MRLHQIRPHGGGLLRQPRRARQERSAEEPRLRKPQRLREAAAEGRHPRASQEHQDWRRLRQEVKTDCLNRVPDQGTAKILRNTQSF